MKKLSKKQMNELAAMTKAATKLNDRIVKFFGENWNTANLPNHVQIQSNSFSLQFLLNLDLKQIQS